jgi:hypothetical protein
MERIKNALYIFGAIIVIIRIFFRDDFSKELNNIIFWTIGIVLLSIIILEVITRKR